MNTRTTSKSALFLMELILAIFFFSLASAVCIQLFAKAHLLGQDTTNKNHGIMWAQNIAEAYLGNDADLAATIDTLQAHADTSDSFSLTFDQDWNVIAPEQAVYKATVQVSESDRMNTAHIVISRVDADTRSDMSDVGYDMAVADTFAAGDSSVIYELSVSKHIPLRAGSK